MVAAGRHSHKRRADVAHKNGSTSCTATACRGARGGRGGDRRGIRQTLQHRRRGQCLKGRGHHQSGLLRHHARQSRSLRRRRGSCHGRRIILPVQVAIEAGQVLLPSCCTVVVAATTG